ncbi:MAG: MFS transporter [candidate division NC10 bacterium]
MTAAVGSPPGARSIAVTFVTLGLSYGVWYAYSVFLVALLREFGWSRSLVAGAFSVFVLVHGLMAPALGWLADRIGPRRLFLAGGLVLAAALWLDGAVSRPWHLYAAFGVVTAAGVSLAGWVPAVVLVQRWFPERVGAALGITSAGIGVGIFLVVPLTQFLVDQLGWRPAFRWLAAAVALWIVPASLFILRDPIVGSELAGGGPGGRARPPGPPPASSARPDITLGEALRMERFWLLSAAQLLGSLASQMLLVHQVAYLVDHEIPAMVAATVVSVVGLASIVGKAGGGWFSDTAGREVTYTLGMACVVASVGTLGVVALRPGPLPAYVYGALVGMGYSVTAPLLPALVSDVFRGRHFGAIFGAMQLANSLGGAFGPWIAGRVFDATGSYFWALSGAVLSASAATASLWVARALRPLPR